MKWAGCLTVGLLTLVTVPLPGKADDFSSLVKLELTECPTVSADEVERILGLELRSIAAGHPDIAARPILLAVACAPGRLSMVAKDSATSQTSSRIRTDAPPRAGMERIIAIAAAELTLSTWEQPAEIAPEASPGEAREDESTARLASASNADATTGAPAAGAPESAPLRGITAAVQISALWRLYLNRKANLFGGEIGGNLYFLRVLRLYLGVTPEGGRTDRALGDVSLFSVSVAFSLGAYGRLFTSPLEFGADIGFCGGYGRMSGRPYSQPSGGAALDGGFGGPLLRLSLASDTRPAVGLSLEVGYVIFGLTGRVGIDSPVEMKGPWISLALDGIFFRN